MAIKKIQANHDNGSSYDILHYETQVGLVKVMDANGNPVSDLEEMLFDGKTLDGVDLNTVTATGKYRVSGGTNFPAGVITDSNTYLLEVSTVDLNGMIMTRQEFYDHVTQETHMRNIRGTTIGSWIMIGESIANAVATMGDLSNLYTSQKGTLVDSINELSGEIQVIQEQDIASLQTQVTDLDTELENHNHDTVYLKLSGGDLTDTVAVANGKSFAGKDSSGAVNLNIGKINATSDVVIGDTTAKTILQTKTNKLYVTDGTHTYEVIHKGNDGVESGLDADMIDGIQGDQLARQDTINYYTQDQIIDNTKSLVMKGTNGSQQAGSILFKTGDTTPVEKAKISVSTAGDITMSANKLGGHIFKSSGVLESTYDHVMNAKNRQVALRFKLDDADGGAGFYMNNSSKQVGFYDWEYGDFFFTTDRDDQMVKFTNSIFIQGHKLSIQSTAPSSPKTGDVWIDI